MTHHNSLCLVECSETTEDIRWDLVEQIRAEIESGTYETPEKLEIALEKLLSDVSR